MSYVSNFGTITSGQAFIPNGAKSYQITVVSGVAFIDGVMHIAGQSIAGGGYDGRQLLTRPIAFGATGAGGTRLSYRYDV